MTAFKTSAAALSLAFLAVSCQGFVSPNTNSDRPRAFSSSSLAAEDGAKEPTGRRAVLSSLVGAATAGAAACVALPGGAFAEAETMERGGVKLTPFNSLAFNYRGGESPTIDPAAIGEPSITYADFLEKLNADQVTFVEFLAPNGDAAYATIKSSSGGEEGAATTTTDAPIRIGEGYPIEDPEGWSSPAFVIKAVAKKGVPYKFVVPGLGDSFKNL